MLMALAAAQVFWCVMYSAHVGADNMIRFVQVLGEVMRVYWS
jgi:hypothetical protein